jgi:genome maintenance exonuclease 1
LNFKLSLLPKVELTTETLHGGRYYITPEGNKYPSVTTVLGRASNMDWLDAWKKRVGEAEAKRISELAMRKGTAVHELCEHFLTNDPMFKFLKLRSMPTTLSSFLSVEPILKANVREIYGIEYPLYSAVLQTAGRADGIVNYMGKSVILDFKTTKSWELKQEDDILNYFLQTTAYGIMTTERTGMKIDGVVILMISESNPPQVFGRSLDKYYRKTMELFDAQAKIEASRS